jgi:GT2 family glycosyltransferase
MSSDLATVTLSVVGHRQSELLVRLLEDVVAYPVVANVIVTLNCDEEEVAVPQGLLGRVRQIRNVRPKGFAENHNQAFAFCKTPYFAVLNPDLRIPDDPFPLLLKTIVRGNAGVCTPAVIGPQGVIEDHAREFPVPWDIFRKLLGCYDGIWPYRLGDPAFSPDWVGGMFMLFDSSAYRRLGGFDPGFFLYYEDVDICARLRKAGYEIVVCPGTHVIHDARRESRRSLRYLRWHVSSMLRFWYKHLGRYPRAKSRG